MHVLADRQKIDNQIKQFIAMLKRAARTDRQALSRKGDAFLVNKTITVSTPLEKPTNPQRVQLVEISADRAAIVAKHYLGVDMLVLVQLTAQGAVPARVSSTKKIHDQHHVELDFVHEYDPEVRRLAENSGSVPPKPARTRGLLAWLTTN